MSFGTWDVRSLYRSGLLTSVARELVRYTLDLVGVQEDRWGKGGSVRTGDGGGGGGKRKKNKPLGGGVFLRFVM